MFENYSDMVGVNELCDMLNIGKNTAYDLIRTNQIYSLRIGKCIRIPKKCIIDFCLSDNDCQYIKQDGKIIS